MAWKYLQVGLAGSARISHTILHAQSVISLCTQCRAERVNLIYYTIRWCTILTFFSVFQNLWGHCGVLQQLSGSHTTLVRAGFLCVHCDDSLVESVHIHSLARSHSCLCQLQCAWSGWARSCYASYNHAICLSLSNHGTGQRLATRQEEISTADQPGRGGSAQREWTHNHWDNEQIVSTSFQALATHRMGCQHYNQSQKGGKSKLTRIFPSYCFMLYIYIYIYIIWTGSHPRWLRCEDNYRWAEQVPRTVWPAHQLRHDQCSPGVHTGGNPGSVLLFPDLLHGSAVDGWQGGGRQQLSEQGGFVFSGFHHAAVLLLHGLAKSGRVLDKSLWRRRWRFRGRLSYCSIICLAN